MSTLNFEKRIEWKMKECMELWAENMKLDITQKIITDRSTPIAGFIL